MPLSLPRVSKWCVHRIQGTGRFRNTSDVSDLSPGGAAASQSGPGRGGPRSRSRMATILFPKKTGGVTTAPPRLLVVDDNDGFRESLIALLVSGGMQVVGEATGGREALELADQLKPDVVLMDVRMPYMDGVETTRRLKAAHPDIRVVAITAQ